MFYASKTGLRLSHWMPSIVSIGIAISLFSNQAVTMTIKLKKALNDLKLKVNSKFLIGALSSFILPLTSQSLYSQDYFEFNNPSFSFSIPDGWKEYNINPSLLMYGKYVKVNNGKIGGILRVGQDIYLDNVISIWNVNAEAEKKQLEKEATLRNFSFKKETINGLETIKINFETTLGKVNNRKEFKAVIYKFLVNQDKKEHVIFFFLITDPKDFYNDNNDLLQIISTLNLTSQKTIFNSKKEVEFKHKKYVISKPVDYDYFSNSVFKNMKINEFTLTYCFTDDISMYDFELLVPKKLDDQPTIHFYTSNALKEQSVTQEDFMEYKLFWKKMYEQPNYEKLLNYIISDSLLFCKYEFSGTEPMTFTHLKDEKKLLSTLVFINAKTDIELTKKIYISNCIYLNDIVIFIVLSQDYKTFSDIEKIQNKSNTIVSEFLKNNTK